MSDANGNSLQTAMEVHALYAVLLSGSPQVISAGPPMPLHEHTVSFIQDVAWTDVPGDYSIDITFRISANV